MNYMIKCRLWRKLNKTTMWLIVQMQSTSKMKLSYHDRLDHVRSVMKTRQDNDVIDFIGLVYTEIEIKLSRPIWPGVVYNKTRQDNNVVDRTSVLYTKNDTKLSWSIRPSVICDKNRARKRDRLYRCGLRFHDIELSWSIGSGINFDKN